MVIFNIERMTVKSIMGIKLASSQQGIIAKHYKLKQLLSENNTPSLCLFTKKNAAERAMFSYMCATLGNNAKCKVLI